MSANILKLLNVNSIRLLSNNPAKFQGLYEEGIDIHSRIPINIAPNRHNEVYLNTKKVKMHHNFENSEELLFMCTAKVD
jgi:GTP cyclohydrolase II